MAAQRPTTHDRPRRRPFGRLAVAAGLASALLISGFVVYSASAAAFVAQTENAGNSWTAGTLALTDNDSTSAMFSVSPLVPTQTATYCLTVTYTGTVAPTGGIKLYAPSGSVASAPGTDGNTTGNIAPNLNWTVEMFDPGAATISHAGADCTATVLPVTQLFGDQSYHTTTTGAGKMMSNFLAGYPSYGSSLATWSPGASPGGSVRVFRFTYRLADDTASNVMGATLGVKLVWEADS